MEWIQTSHTLLKQNLPQRDPQAHKGDFGKVLIVSGSHGYAGAPALAALAALRTGSGLIYVTVPECIYPVVAGKLLEPMVFGYPAEGDGFSALAIPKILDRLASCDACLIGPGLGRTSVVFQLVQTVLRESTVPVVVDADGLNVLAGHIDILREATCPIVLTPHWGEFLRLTNGLSSEDRQMDARNLAEETGCIVLLKGHQTLITDGKTGYWNGTGNPGMATGGSGDVLGGIIVSLIGQKVPPLVAAACGAWVHGAAGDICAREIGECGMTPSDLIQAVPRLFK